MRILHWIDVTAFLVFAGFVVTHMEWSPVHVIGLAFAAAGFVLWMVARVQLGRSFTVTAQAKGLVTHGLYAKFRYPVYLFGGIAFTGLFVAWNAMLAVPYLLFYCVMQGLRIRKEDAVLEKEFGEAYRQYKARTWV